MLYVSLQRRLPELAHGLIPGSAKAALYHKMTSHHKLKSDMENIGEQLYTIGHFHWWRPDESLFRQIQGMFPDVTDIWKFECVFYKNQVFHCEIYSRAKRRNSYTAMMYIDDKPCPVTINYYLKCNTGQTCVNLAVVQKLTETPSVQINLKHIIPVTLDATRKYVVPLHCLIEQLVYLKNCNFGCICRFPNNRTGINHLVHDRLYE